MVHKLQAGRNHRLEFESSQVLRIDESNPSAVWCSANVQETDFPGAPSAASTDIVEVVRPSVTASELKSFLRLSAEDKRVAASAAASGNLSS